MKDLKESLVFLKNQSDQMSKFCEELMENIDSVDADAILKLEKDFLAYKKRILNSANGVSREFIALSKSPAKK